VFHIVSVVCLVMSKCPEAVLALHAEAQTLFSCRWTRTHPFLKTGTQTVRTNVRLFYLSVWDIPSGAGAETHVILI
jgi:hypothetical protein